MSTNRHPVDELADVRAEIKSLQAREAKLRSALMEPGADLSGDEHYARVAIAERETLDGPAALKALGKDALARFMRKSTTTTVRLISREQDEAA